MLAVCISFPHRHTGHSVKPGTRKRSNADMIPHRKGKSARMRPALLCSSRLFKIAHLDRSDQNPVRSKMAAITSPIAPLRRSPIQSRTVEPGQQRTESAPEGLMRKVGPTNFPLRAKAHRSAARSTQDHSPEPNPHDYEHRHFALSPGLDWRGEQSQPILTRGRSGTSRSWQRKRKKSQATAATH
jgi:hypothetical protein